MYSLSLWPKTWPLQALSVRLNLLTGLGYFTIVPCGNSKIQTWAWFKKVIYMKWQLALHPSTTKMFNFWMWGSFHSISMIVPDFPGFPGNGECQIFHSHPAPKYWAIISCISNQGVERAIKVSHCLEIITTWCLRPGLEIMSALVGPQGRRKVSMGMWDAYSVTWTTGTGTELFF